jgi:predicted helicase
MTLRETGVEEFKERVGIYLTNSLEEGKVNPDDLFGSFGLMDTITKESSEASRIKTEYPVMVVIGNPPYSISSNNKGEWIQNQIKEYKKHLNERNIQPLSDDYIKFIRFSEFLIEKNGEGVVAMITNNSFLDGIIHKQMRKHLLETFDQIYIVDLHGNARKSEQTKSGLKDENVFKIMQGVSINIFVKNNKKKKGVLAKVFSFDLQGLQKDKFEYLDLNSLEKIIWNSVDYTEPNYFFTKKDFSGQFEYEKGFKLDELIKDYSSGVKTHHDSELISIQPFEENNFVYYYKPYDIQYINYDLKKVVRAREAHTRNYLKQINLGLILQRGFLDTNISTSSQIIVTKIISDINFLKAQTYNFPLYLYFDNGLKTPNLDKYIWSKLNETTEETKPEDILDYIYAVLHSPKYRETYKEFLKIDFPRVPYPKSKKEFWNLVPLGTQLRELHLLEAKELESFNLGITFIGDGEVVVEKPLWMDNKIYLNKEHYFEGVSKEVFEFYIGGYQPAQKWLKDRKGRALTAEDIIHYKKMCVSMRRTIEIMKEIDTVIL